MTTLTITLALLAIALANHGVVAPPPPAEWASGSGDSSSSSDSSESSDVCPALGFAPHIGPLPAFNVPSMDTAIVNIGTCLCIDEKPEIIGEIEELFCDVIDFIGDVATGKLTECSDFVERLGDLAEDFVELLTEDLGIELPFIRGDPEDMIEAFFAEIDRVICDGGVPHIPGELNTLLIAQQPGIVIPTNPLIGGNPTLEIGTDPLP